MKKIFYFLMTMPILMALSSCNDSDSPDSVGESEIPWGERTGNLNDTWIIAGEPLSHASTDNVLAQNLIPILINMLNTTPEAQAYRFNEDKTYAQYWESEEPNDEETGLYKETGSYVRNDSILTFTYTDGQTGEAKTAEYVIVSLSDTQLVLYKDILGIWGSLAAAIVEPFDKLGITPKRAYKIITYTNVVPENSQE
jgi:hypothetical protein